MRRIRTTIIIELLVILIYLIITLFSITIQPINLILGIFCILVIPGYNLLKIFKPQSTIIQKLGYITILSLAIGNIFMFFSYLFLFDLTVLTEDTGFIFDSVMLIASLQILNLTLIAINELILLKKRPIDINTHKVQNYFHSINFHKIFKNYDLRSLISYIIFFLSIIFLCLSTYYSAVSNNSFDTVYVSYRTNFLFFFRVPSIFYIFLSIVIIILVYIIFFNKNKYLILLSISIFLYTLWILPYLQIGNFFTHDSYFLYDSYQNYLNFGIKPAYNYSFTQGNPDLTVAYRYSTSLFTTILLVNATQINVISVLWFIYPLYFISIPFFFYYIFQKYSNKKAENSKNTRILVLTIIAIVAPQFIKYGHSATTGLFGTYIFFILVVEFYFFTNEKEFNKKQIIFITFFFFFLALTHTEECVYFLILVLIYSIFQISIKYNNINRNEISKFKTLRKYTLFWALFVLLLSLIFYFTLEFFGWIPAYMSKTLSKESIGYNFIFNIYSSSKFFFIINLQNSFSMSFIFIFLISIGVLLFYSIFYLFLTKFKKILVGIKDFGSKICKIFHKIIVKVISKKYFLFLLLIIIYGGIFMYDQLFFYIFEEWDFFTKKITLYIIIILILNSTIFVINIIIFIYGIKYYKIKNHLQNYYLLAIFCSSLTTGFLFLVGNYYLGPFAFIRFFSYFIFFNLIIVEGTSFRNFMKKNKILQMIFVILLLFIGFFYSLRTLAYG